MGWDSNPRTLAGCRFSRPVPSTARPPIRGRNPSLGNAGRRRTLSAALGGAQRICRVNNDSNFGGIVPWWDRLFGTYVAEPAAGHEAMVVGLPGYTGRQHLALLRMLADPFVAPARRRAGGASDDVPPSLDDGGEPQDYQRFGGQRSGGRNDQEDRFLSGGEGARLALASGGRRAVFVSGAKL